ncbi:MAG: CAP domain-containing protein [Patescibacteria group bacterium]
MSKFLKVLIRIIILILVTAGFVYFFRDVILKSYNDNLQKFEKTDLGNIINEIKREVLAPVPLNVGGQSNQVVLVRSKVIAETNIQRYNNGMLLPLIENTMLNQAALAKANDMFLKQYFEHISPIGVGPGDLVKTYSYDYVVTGENLILGNFKNEKEVVQLWMNSLGHRANILNERFTEIGVAVIKGTYNGQTTWIGVQEFGLPLSSCDQPSLNLRDQIDINQSQLSQLSLQINELKNEIDNTNKRSPEYNQLVQNYNQLVNNYNALVQDTKNLILQYNNEVNLFNQCVSG